MCGHYKRPPKIYRLTFGPREGELDAACSFDIARTFTGANLPFLRATGVAEELHRFVQVRLQASDGALALLVFLDHPQLVEEGGLLHVTDVRDDEDLPECPLQAVERKQHVAPPFSVQRAKDLVQN